MRCGTTAGDESYLVCAAVAKHIEGTKRPQPQPFCTDEVASSPCCSHFTTEKHTVSCSGCPPHNTLAWLTSCSHSNAMWAPQPEQETHRTTHTVYKHCCKTRRWKLPQSVRRFAAGVALVPSMCFATMLVPVCVVLCVSWSCGARSHWNGCMMLHGLCVGEEAGARNLVFFPCKVAAAGDESYLVCAALYGWKNTRFRAPCFLPTMLVPCNIMQPVPMRFWHHSGARNALELAAWQEQALLQNT